MPTYNGRLQGKIMVLHYAGTIMACHLDATCASDHAAHEAESRLGFVESSRL